jgi:hypothetical protein
MTDPLSGFESAHTRVGTFLDSTASNAKYLHFAQGLVHFDALDQNPLDLISFPVVRSCSTPAVSPHPSPDLFHYNHQYERLVNWAI